MKAQFARFLLVGGIAAAANIGSRALFGLWIEYVPAMVLAFCIGLSTAFLLNRGWVFDRSGRHWSSEALWFLVINLLGLALTIAIGWGLGRQLFPMLGLGPGEPWDTLAHAVGVGAPIITSFIGHKYLTFRKRQHV